MFNKKLKEEIRIQKEKIEKLKEKNEDLYRHLTDTYHCKIDNLEDHIIKIKELLKGYESTEKILDNRIWSYDVALSDEFSNDCYLKTDTGRLLTSEYIPTFTEFFRDFINIIPFEKRPDFYREVKPIMRKYITSEKDLFNLEMCMKNKETIYKPKLKKRRNKNEDRIY